MGGIEFCDCVLDRIAETRPVFAMPNETVRFLRDPGRVFRTLKAAGHDVPNLFSPGSDDSSMPDSTCRWLRKDSNSSGGQSVCRLDQAEVKDALAALSPTEYVQQEIKGLSCSATFLADGRGHSRLVGCSFQLSGVAALNGIGFQFCGNAGPIKLFPSCEQQIISIERTLNRHCLLRGAWGIDFVLQQDRVFPIEVNPRLTASHELYDRNQPNTSCQVWEHCRAFGFDRVSPASVSLSGTPSVAADDFTVRMVLYSDQTFVLDRQAHSILIGARRGLTGDVTSFWISDIPDAGTTIAKGTPFCSLNISAETPAGLEASWCGADASVKRVLRLPDPTCVEALIASLIEQWESATA